MTIKNSSLSKIIINNVGIIAFFILLTVLYFLVYNERPNWDGWWDQSWYLKSAVAFSTWDLRESEHWYPIAYSLIASPFVKIWPSEPFLLVNFVFFLIYARAYVGIFQPVIGLPLAALTFILALSIPLKLEHPILVDFPLLQQFIIPWTTIPISSIYMCILWCLSSLPNDKGRKNDFILGALAVSILFIRPADALPLFLPGLYYLYIRGAAPGAIRYISSAIIGASCVLLPGLLLMFLIYGGISSPYGKLSTDIGLSLSNIGDRAYSIFLDSSTVFGEHNTALVDIMPWLYIAIPLSLSWLIVDFRRSLLTLTLVVSSAVMYLAYNDFWPYNIFRFYLVHYIVWCFPILAAAAVAGAISIVRRKSYILFLLCCCMALLLGSYRFTPVLLESNITSKYLKNSDLHVYNIGFNEYTNVDAVDIVGALSEDSTAVTLHRIDLKVDDNSLELFRGYRIIQLNGGVRIVFNKNIKAKKIDIIIKGNGGINKLPSESYLIQPIYYEGKLGKFWKPVEKLSLNSSLASLISSNSNITWLTTKEYDFWKYKLKESYSCFTIYDSYSCNPSSANALKMEPSKDHFSYSSDVSGMKGLKHGWFSSEGWGTWSNGKHSVLIAPLSNVSSEKLNVKLMVNVFNGTAEDKVAQSILIFQGGQEIFNETVEFGTYMPYEVAFIVDRKKLVSRGFLDLEFFLEDNISPADVALNDDSRKIAVGLVSMDIYYD